MSTSNEPMDGDGTVPFAATLAPERSQEYTIRVVSRMTGFPVDTLRMWERRYAFPSPRRDAAGNRLYSADDVDRLNMVSEAMKLGYRAGKAIREPVENLQRLVAGAGSARPSDVSHEGLANSMELLALAQSQGISGLRRRLHQLAGLIGAQRFVIQVAGPMTDTVRRERAQGDMRLFETHLVLGVLSDELRFLLRLYRCSTGPRVLLAAPPRIGDVIGLEMAALIASLAGASVEVLSSDPPSVEIVDAAISLKAQALIVDIGSAAAPTVAAAQMGWLDSHLPAPVGLWLSGKGSNMLENLPSRVRIIGTWQDLAGYVSALINGI